MAFVRTTITTLRTSTTLSTTDEYYVTDAGLDGFWKYSGEYNYHANIHSTMFQYQSNRFSFK